MAGSGSRKPWSQQQWEMLFMLVTVAAALLTLKPSGVFHHMSQIVEGVVLAFALMRFSPLVRWAVISVLGIQTTLVTIGEGPVIWRGVGRSRVVLLRMFPFRVAVHSLPGLEHYRRDVRLSIAASLFVPALVTAIPALVLPNYVTLTALIAACPGILGFAMTKRTKLFDPAIAIGRHADYAVSFGDVETAQRLISEPSMQGRPASVAVTEAIHEIRGEHEAALASLAGYPESARQFATLEALRLGFIAAEAGGADITQVVADAKAAISGLTALAKLDMYASLMALYHVESGQPRDARPWANEQLARAKTPLEIADSLCTRARVEAALGRTEQATRTLRRAHAVAPWYARVDAVRDHLGSGHMAEV